LYPLFLSSFEASCLVSILPSISWVTGGFWHSFTYRSRWRRVAGWSSGGFTSRTITSSIAMAVMVVMIIMMYV
jgi:uncharacterized membrane protein